MKNILYGTPVDQDEKDSGYIRIRVPNGKDIQIRRTDVESAIPVTSVANGMTAFYLKGDAKVILETDINDSAFAEYVDEQANTYPKYYDDDGGTPHKSYDDPYSDPRTARKYFDDDACPSKNFDDGLSPRGR